MRESAGTVAQTGDLILVKGPDNNIDRNGRGGKLEHERWMGSWNIIKTFDAGLTIRIVLGRRNTHTRHVLPGCTKPFYARPPDLRHHLTNELTDSLYVVGRFRTIHTLCSSETPRYLCDCRQVTLATRGTKIAESQNSCQRQRS